MNLLDAFTKLQELAKEADDKKLSVFAGEFEREFPEYAEDIKQTLTRKPDDALAYLCGKYRALTVLQFMPGAAGWIEALQRAYGARANT